MDFICFESILLFVREFFFLSFTLIDWFLLFSNPTIKWVIKPLFYFLLLLKYLSLCLWSTHFLISNLFVDKLQSFLISLPQQSWIELHKALSCFTIIIFIFLSPLDFFFFSFFVCLWYKTLTYMLVCSSFLFSFVGFSNEYFVYISWY